MVGLVLEIHHINYWRKRMTDKVRMLLDVVDEVKREAPEDVPNWNAKLA